MDRDPLSKDRFVKNFGGRLANVAGWNGGRNHIIFNLWSFRILQYSEVGSLKDPRVSQCSNFEASDMRHRGSEVTSDSRPRVYMRRATIE